MKKRVIVIAAVCVVVAGAILGLTVFRNGKNGSVTYRKEKLTKGDIQALVVTSGTLNPIELVDVGSQVSGKIVKLPVDFNSQITKGEILAELDTEPLEMKVQQNEANYQSSLASVDRAQVTLDTSTRARARAKELADKKLISSEELETAEANYLSAKSDLTSAKARLAQAKSALDLSKVDLSYAIIKSPVDGTIITRKVSLGQTVQASFNAPVLFQVATDLTKMKVECSVDEADIGKVKENQPVNFTVEAFPDETFRGQVVQVRYASETVQNVVTYTTIVNVENPEKKLRPGMTATVNIVVGEAKDVVRVPNSALRFNPTKLTPEQMQAAYKEAFDEIMAKRGANGGPMGGPEGAADRQAAAPSAEGGAPAAAMTAGGQGQGQRMFGQFGGQGGPGRGGDDSGGAQRARRQPNKVWVQDAEGKLHVRFLRLGVTDNTYTQLLRGDLKEGDEVLTGEAGPNAQADSFGPPRGGVMMMGGPRR